MAEKETERRKWAHIHYTCFLSPNNGTISVLHKPIKVHIQFGKVGKLLIQAWNSIWIIEWLNNWQKWIWPNHYIARFLSGNKDVTVVRRFFRSVRIVAKRGATCAVWQQVWTTYATWRGTDKSLCKHWLCAWEDGNENGTLNCFHLKLYHDRNRGVGVIQILRNAERGVGCSGKC